MFPRKTVHYVRFITLWLVVALMMAACAPPAPAPTPTAAPATPTPVPAQPTATPVPAQPTATAAPAPAAADPNRRLTIYVVQHALCAWDSWWCTMKEAMEQAASDLNIDLTVLGPDRFDLQKVAQLIDQAVAARPDGLAVTVTDPQLFKEHIQRAIDAGIPVVGFNAGNGPDKDGIPYMTYIGQDEYQGGYQAGKRLAAVGGKAGVCINHQVGGTNLDARCRGFADALAEAGIPAEVLGITDDPASSQTTISDYFTAHPEVDIALTLGPNGANPFYAFLKEAGLEGQIKHGTFDTSPEINAAIEAGITLFGIDQQPYLQGYGSLATLALAIRYGIKPALPVTATGPGFVTKADLGFQPDPKRPVKIIAVQHALCAWDAFWCVVEKGIQTAAQQMRVDVQVLGPDRFDLQKVAQLIDQAVAAKPDGIMLTFTDPDLFRAPVQRALDAGIPVVAYNAGNGPEKDGVAYLTYLGQDEYQGGYQGGKRLAAAGGKAGVCINHQVGGANLDARCRGFADALAEAGIPAEVLGISDDPAASQTTISDYFTAHPEVDIVLTLGPNGANPFYAYAKEAGLKAGDVKHGTFDVSPEIVARIKDGFTLFAIDQQPFLQGYGAVMALQLKVRQGISPALPVTPTGPGFVDAGNVDLVAALSGQYR
jgi:simple sugar transport system substrate-binding protein